RALDRFRTDHYLVSMVERQSRRVRCLWRESLMPADYRHRGEFVHRRCGPVSGPETLATRTSYRRHIATSGNFAALDRRSSPVIADHRRLCAAQYERRRLLTISWADERSGLLPRICTQR